MAVTRKEFTDDLTGLYNRRYFRKKIRSKLRDAQRTETDLSIVLVDLDHFKNINDTYGHSHGDLLLKEFAVFLKNSLRKYDTIFRYGGDEFIYILPRTDYQQAQRIAQCFLEQCRSREFVKVRLTLSIGIASSPDSMDWQTLFDIADQNLYIAKRHGRDQIGIFEKKRGLTIPTQEIIGRDSEMEKIEKLIESIFRNSSNAVFISGEVGVGKTRLVTEAVNDYLARNVQSLKSDLSATTKSIPYYPFREIIRSMINTKGKEFIKGLGRAYKIELMKIVPELSEESKESDSDIFMLDKFRLFEGMKRFLALSCSDRPILLFIDNIHWADDGSLELLYYLVKSLKNSPIFFFFVYRIEETKGDSFQNVLHLMSREGLYDKIALEPLKTAEVARMLSFIIDNHPPIELTNFIVNQTGGNAFFIEELMKSLEIHGALVWQDNKVIFNMSKKVVIPNSVEGVIDRKLDVLDDKALDLLDYAAVIGREIDFNFLRDIVKINEGYLFDLIDKILELKLLKETGGGGYCFSEDIIREIIYSSITKRKLEHYHQIVGEKLLNFYRDRVDEVVEELSEHFYLGKDWMKTVEYCMLAADKARNSYANRDAIKFFSRALECLPKGGIDEEIKKEITCLRKRANVLHLVGENEKAAEDLKRAINKAKELDDEKEEADCVVILGSIYQSTAQYKEALKQTEAAMRIYKGLNDKRGEASAINITGLIYWKTGEYQKALKVFHRAVKIGEEIGDRKGESASLNNIGIIHGLIGEYPEALKFFERALQIAEDIGDRKGASASLNNIGSINGPLGDFDKALQFFQRSLKIKQEIGDRGGESTSLENIGNIYSHLGEYSKALEYFQNSLKIEEEIGGGDGQASILVNIGSIYTETKDYTAAEEYYNKAYTIAHDIKSKPRLADVFVGFVSLYLTKGELNAAKKSLDQLISLADELGSKANKARAYSLSGRFYAKKAKYDKARSAFKEAIAIFKELDEKLSLAEVFYYQGFLFKTLKDTINAKKSFRKALKICKELGAEAWIKKIKKGI